MISPDIYMTNIVYVEDFNAEHEKGAFIKQSV